ncbi:DUF4231 domain-containing protein [Actinoplanes sp. NPDC049548]|uniref:DUF4231 domain-containing protein n=1 Tax=Actinoplanes sp. NPDC049548 TaxID=3155152 RepID=UPI0034131AD4
MNVEDRFPPVLADAEAASAQGQASFLRFTLAGLVLACIAAVGGAVDVSATVGGKRLDLGALVAALAFAAAIGVATYALSTKPQQRWYEGRAAAESVKTLAWQYSVAGGAFRHDASVNAEDLLAARLVDIMREMRSVVTRSGTGQITDAMARLRDEPLERRRKRYLSERVDSQIAWYAGKAAFNEARVRVWFAVVIVAQSVGLVAGALKAFDVVDVDVLGILAAVAASAAAWLQTKDHQNLAQSYAVTARELQIIRTRAERMLGAGPTEDEWADFVEESERAISREHTLWLARRESV